MTARVCLQFETGILASGCGSRAFSSLGPAGVGRKAFIFISEISVAAFLRCSYINKRPSAQRRAAYKLLHGFGLLKYLFYICRRWLPNGITRRQGEVADYRQSRRLCLYRSLHDRHNCHDDCHDPRGGSVVNIPSAYLCVHIPAKAAGAETENQARVVQFIKKNWYETY